MSGISMVLKNGNPKLRDNVKYSKMIVDTIKNSKEFLKFEMMFNAYHEAGLMDKYLSKHNYFGATWHADSGGLQMVTQNKTITDEWKDKIYDIQSKHSSYAMCFDEMPIYVAETAGIASRLDLSGRRYIREWTRDKAIQTGKNVKRQIEIIRKNNSDTKVFIICQGNKTQDFVDYFDNVVDQLPPDYYTSIAGVALSAACTGLGMLESIRMAASYRKMSIPKGIGKKLHFLGYGSINRLRPMMYLEASGYLDADITFDSSSHAMGCLLGEVNIRDSEVLKTKKHAFGNRNGKTAYTDSIYTHLYIKYQSVFKKYYPNITKDTYLAIVGIDHTTSKRYRKRRMAKGDIKKHNVSIKDSIVIQLYTRFLVAFESYTTFSKNMDKDYHNINSGNINDSTALKKLAKVKTTEQYDTWEDNYSDYVESNRIKDYATEADAKADKPITLNGEKTETPKTSPTKDKKPYHSSPAITFG
jgi:hypothetical protein